RTNWVTNAEELPLEPASQLPTVLHRPQPLRVEPRRPAEQLVAADDDRLLGERPSRPVDGNRRHRLLVYVQPDHDHLHRLQAVAGDRRADRPQPRPKATPLSGHARRSRSAATTQRWKVRPTQSTFGIKSAAADRVSASHRTP